MAVVAYVAAEDIDPVQVEAKAQTAENPAQEETGGVKVPPKLQKRGLYGWGWGPGWGYGGYGWGHPGYYGKTATLLSINTFDL